MPPAWGDTGHTVTLCPSAPRQHEAAPCCLPCQGFLGKEQPSCCWACCDIPSVFVSPKIQHIPGSCFQGHCHRLRQRQAGAGAFCATSLCYLGIIIITITELLFHSSWFAQSALSPLSSCFGSIAPYRSHPTSALPTSPLALQTPAGTLSLGST